MIIDVHCKDTDSATNLIDDIGKVKGVNYSWNKNMPTTVRLELMRIHITHDRFKQLLGLLTDE